MRIGINGYEAVVPRFGFDEKTGNPRRVGSSEFCFRLLESLKLLDSDNDFTTYLPINKFYDLPTQSPRWKYKVVHARKLWTMIGLSRYLYQHKDIDVFFSPTHYLPIYIPVPSVLSILDVSYKYFPELFNKRDLYQLKLWGRYSVKRASAIITISESSKNDIITEYNVERSKVHVVSVGIKEFGNPKFKSMEELAQKYHIKSPYILFVGTLQPRKNISKLIEAFSLLKQGYELVIIGKKGWMYDEILAAPHKYGVESHVKFLDYVSDEDLPSFYKHAELFVLPSLYEGFGLPVLEAMKYDCPVATSNISSLPEAGGDAAIYFDPKDAGDIAQSIEKVVNNKELRDMMIKKGREQIKKFSWEKSAKETLAVLESVVQK
jgi:glycosyltransferase involved in cell wall biosynthesis